MPHDKEQRPEEDLDPALREAREPGELDEATRGQEEHGPAEVDAVLARLQVAVESGEEPAPEDIALAQEVLGNARVSAILAGEKDASPVSTAEKVDEGDPDGTFRVGVYVRGKWTKNAYDMGHAFIVVEQDGQRRVFGFHPRDHFPDPAKDHRTPGSVRDDEDQLVDASRVADIAVSRTQLEGVQSLAERLLQKTPDYSHLAWNSVDFVREILGQARVDLPKDTFERMASPDKLVKDPHKVKKKKVRIKGAGGEETEEEVEETAKPAEGEQEEAEGEQEAAEPAVAEKEKKEVPEDKKA
jgi:hypothetical protein